MAENQRKRVVELPTADEQQDPKSGVKLILKSNKDGKELYVIVREKVKIRSVLRRFCQHVSLDYRSTRFVINHRDFSHDKTPNQLGLQDDDQIDALIDGNGA